MLTPEEFQDLEPVFAQYGLTPPSPAYAVVAGAFTSEGQCVGFQCLQLFPHAEPLWIADDYRDEVSCHKLFDLLEEPFLEAQAGAMYVFVDNEKMDQIAQSVGFKPTAYKILIKEY
jgi:hypothetical protein